MRYVLIENAIVRCDDITQYAELETNVLFQGKDFFEDGDYSPILQEIKSFLDMGLGSHELVVSTLFYQIPCFIRVLQDYLGNSVKIIPLYALIGKDNLMEVYDHYTIETSNDHGNISCNFYQDYILGKISRNDSMKGYVQKNGLDTIHAINDLLNNPVCPTKNLDDVAFLLSDYDQVLKKKDGFSLFSPYGALKFYEKVFPGIGFIESIATKPLVEKSIPASFSVSFYSGNITFDKAYKTWIFMEEGRGLGFNRTIGKSSKSMTLTLPASMFNGVKLQVQSLSLSFSKFYLDIERDYMGQLQIIVQSIDNRVFYILLRF